MLALSIIIVNWNAGRQLRDCIGSIGRANHDGFMLSEVIVVDNASSDDSLDGVDKLGVPVVVFRNSENKGFAAACNQGAAEASGDHLLFLNPDTRLFENSLSMPLAYMQQPENQDVGIVGIQLFDEQNHVARSCARFPGLGIFAAQAMGLNRLPGLQHLNTHMTDWGHDATRTVDHVIGAFYLIRRPLFDLLGGFDERFFVYLEDLDLSLRAHQAGWRSVYLVGAQAFHAGGGTSAQVKAARLFYSLRSRIYYGFKHFTFIAAWGLLFITLAVEPWMRLGLALLKGSWSDARHTLQAYILLINALPEMLSYAR
jgi:hypothetical protein